MSACFFSSPLSSSRDTSVVWEKKKRTRCSVTLVLYRVDLFPWSVHFLSAYIGPRSVVWWPEPSSPVSNLLHRPIIKQERGEQEEPNRKMLNVENVKTTRRVAKNRILLEKFINLTCVCVGWRVAIVDLKWIAKKMAAILKLAWNGNNAYYTSYWIKIKSL